MQHLLLVTDGSSGAWHATAAKLAKAVAARLSVLTVAGHQSGDELKQLARAERDIGGTLDALSDQILAHAKQRAQRAGVWDVNVHAGWGDPAEVIIETARRLRVDSIVSRRARGAWPDCSFAPNRKRLPASPMRRDPGSMGRAVASPAGRRQISHAAFTR